MDHKFGTYLRQRRLERLKHDGEFTLRRVAKAVNVQPSFISKVENGMVLPSEDKIVALAKVLKEDPDVLLALAGKVPRELREVIIRRPRLFAQVIRELKDAPEEAVLRVVREVRDATRKDAGPATQGYNAWPAPPEAAPHPGYVADRRQRAKDGPHE